MTNTHLVIIDPQNDFCDPHGALFVPGAKEDMERLAQFIRANVERIDDIHVTLDSHHYLDVAHPAMWSNAANEHPAPFTIIRPEDVEKGVWKPLLPELAQYVKQLEANGRYPLCIWPPHCLIGSWGHSVYPAIHDALIHWAAKTKSLVNYVTKGSNIKTEHYSAVRADVPDPLDHSTQLNSRFVSKLEDADVILLAGEAGSHCLRHTVIDVADALQDDAYVQKFVLLRDATSPVPGFEKNQDEFIDIMTKRGMQLSFTTTYYN